MIGTNVDELLRSLTLAQRASLTSGGDFWHTQAIPEAGIPAAHLTDGPHGLRKQADGANAIGLGKSVPATCFPPAVALGSSWDVDLLNQVGRAIGDEARGAGVAVVLGPGVNIKRSPLCGRNFEYLSEDPFVASRLGAAFVQGAQSSGVGTSLKHYAANNQETDRLRVSADVDERTLREIYLAAFEHVVKVAQPMTVMCSYNKINGTYASEHRHLLTEILRHEWGFEGVVVSDWGAVSDRVKALAAGLDLEMPPSHSDQRIVDAVRDGALKENVLDDAVRRVLTLVQRTSTALEDVPAPDHERHHALARTAAISGAVLLKNEGGILPLDPTGDATVAVIGEFARSPRYQGAGSSQVVPTRLDTARDAIADIAGPQRVTFAAGYSRGGEADPDLVAEAVGVAREANVVILFLGLPPAAESEGFDRTDILLPADQLLVLDAVSEVNSQVVVVLSNGGVVSISEWGAKARAILEGWLLGQAGGAATAELLFGRANPSGCLTETIPVRLEDTPSYLHFPGAEQHVRYGEGIYVGYRYYDSADRPVAYPFGFGLSYTTFELDDLVISETDSHAFDVTLAVTNSGTRAGHQVVQLYVEPLGPGIDRPVRALAGFAKTFLVPGETAKVTISLDERAFSYWSIGEHRWRVQAGQYAVCAGTSSRHIRLRQVLTVAGDGIVGAIDASSTVDEWFAHPVAGPLLEYAMAAAPGPALSSLKPELRKIIGAMPIGKLASFGFSLSSQQLDELLLAIDAGTVQSA